MPVPVSPLVEPLPVHIESKEVTPPPMMLWQLAIPSLLAVFLALIAIRGGVESNAAYSRFWNDALAGKSAISIELDGDGQGAVSPALADAAMPLEALATAFQLPVHLAAADGWRPAAGMCVIRLSTKQKPALPALLSFNGAAVYRGSGGANLCLWAETAEKLRAAAHALASRSEFPELN
jgi:hypothetical protein